MTDEELKDLERQVREKQEAKEIAEERSERVEAEVKQEVMEINEKSIDEISLSDIKVKLNTEKSVEEQAEDVVGALTTVSAIKDDGVKQTLTDKKAEELVNKAEEKATKAKKSAVDAETELQKAERDLHEAVLNTFGIYKHLPRPLMKFLVYLFSPIYTIITMIIGIPCGFCKILIDNLDGIVCRYDKTGDVVKPKIKTIFWIIFSLGVVAAICLTVLACLHII